jgi:hypothetical protein
MVLWEVVKIFQGLMTVCFSRFYDWLGWFDIEFFEGRAVCKQEMWHESPKVCTHDEANVA